MTRWLSTITLLVALLTVLVALTPLAYATPPDPTWVSGVFDDDDNDDSVFLITSSLAAFDPFPLCSWTPFPGFGTPVALEEPGSDDPHYASTTDARAPPLS